MSITIRCEELSARELEAIRAAASELVGAVKAHNDWISVQGNPMPTALGMHEKLNKLARAFDGCNTAIMPAPSDLPESGVMRVPPNGWTPIFWQLFEAFGNVWRELYGAPFTATRCRIDPPRGQWSAPGTIQSVMLDSVLARWPSTPSLAQESTLPSENSPHKPDMESDKSRKPSQPPEPRSDTKNFLGWLKNRTRGKEPEHGEWEGIFDDFLSEHPNSYDSREALRKAKDRYPDYWRKSDK